VLIVLLLVHCCCHVGCLLPIAGGDQGEEKKSENKNKEKTPQKTKKTEKSKKKTGTPVREADAD
jgi:hypothetical protein